MNNKDFHTELARMTGLTDSDTDRLLDGLIHVMKQHLAKGDSVQLNGFGFLEVKTKEQRILVHPKTKKRILTPPKMVVTFRPSKTLKEKCK